MSMNVGCADSQRCEFGVIGEASLHSQTGLETNEVIVNIIDLFGSFSLASTGLVLPVIWSSVHSANV
jgi:hypothetical protein